MMEQKFDLERLRPAEYVCEPDPRSTMFVMIDRTNGTSRPIELADHHELISAYALHAGVPQEIVLQFETARNVYLYAWFVYRFYPVAEHQSLACLELALRERLKEEIRTGKIKSERPTLRPLLKYAVDHGLVKNEGFSAWQNHSEINSRHRVEMEKLREASEKNLTEITWDESDTMSACGAAQRASRMDPEVRRHVEKNIFSAAISAVEPWDSFKWHTSGRLCDTGKPHSSQALAIDFFGTLKQASQEERDVILGGVAQRIGLPPAGPWSIELEWEDPQNRLHESGKKTQVDTLATSPGAVICFECKFTEPDGGCCSQVLPISSGKNKGEKQCNGRYEVQVNPAKGPERSRCSLTAKGIRYWEVIPKVFDLDPLKDCSPCPFSGTWYQWMRNLVLANELGRKEQRKSAFVVVYADHKALPFPAVLKTQRWQQLLNLVRRDAVGLHVISYQEVLSLARERACRTNQVWRDLEAWIQGKITEVGLLKESSKTIPCHPL